MVDADLQALLDMRQCLDVVRQLRQANLGVPSPDSSKA